MNEIKSFDYNGSRITFSKGSNVMVNANQMSAKFGKKPKDWLRTQQSSDYLKELSKVKKCPLADLVQVTKGGDNPGTWMHEDVALEFARWLSPAFAIWCNDRIKELLTYGMTATQPTLEAMVDNPDLVIKLATQLKEERAEKARLQFENEQQSHRLELQDNTIKEQAPKVSYYDTTLQSVNTLTATQIAKQIGMDANKLNRKLREAGLIYHQSGQWLLHAPYSTWGLHATRTQTYTRSDGSIGTSIYTVWTNKGMRLIIAMSENEWNIKRAVKAIKGENAA